VTEQRIPCVGALVVHDGRLLVVRRGRSPGRGLWSVPGGRVERGESLQDAVVREVAEETGLAVRPGAVVGRVERAAPANGVYVIDDLSCELDGPAAALRAGDDADEARWVSRGELERLACVDLLVETLEGWGVLDELTP
jgi:ADP-ribose pyrophosphatase YjhB (NUDIX family)